MDRTNCDTYKECYDIANLLGISEHTDEDHCKCFCKSCAEARGESPLIVYTRGTPASRYAPPIGWVRIGLKLKENVRQLFSKWHVAYHGTTATNIKAIVQDGTLKVPDNKTVFIREGHIPDQFFYFTTPSILYASFGLYASPFQLKNQWWQIVVQTLQQPSTYQKSIETSGLGSACLDPCFPNAEVEWKSQRPRACHVYGILLRKIPNKEPTSYPPGTYFKLDGGLWFQPFDSQPPFKPASASMRAVPPQGPLSKVLQHVQQPASLMHHHLDNMSTIAPPTITASSSISSTTSSSPLLSSASAVVGTICNQIGGKSLGAAVASVAASLAAAAASSTAANTNPNSSSTIGSIHHNNHNTSSSSSHSTSTSTTASRSTSSSTLTLAVSSSCCKNKIGLSQNNQDDEDDDEEFAISHGTNLLNNIHHHHAHFNNINFNNVHDNHVSSSNSSTSLNKSGTATTLTTTTSSSSIAAINGNNGSNKDTEIEIINMCMMVHDGGKLENNNSNSNTNKRRSLNDPNEEDIIDDESMKKKENSISLENITPRKRKVFEFPWKKKKVVTDATDNNKKITLNSTKSSSTSTAPSAALTLGKNIHDDLAAPPCPPPPALDAIAPASKKGEMTMLMVIDGSEVNRQHNQNDSVVVKRALVEKSASSSSSSVAPSSSSCSLNYLSHPVYSSESENTTNEYHFKTVVTKKACYNALRGSTNYSSDGGGEVRLMLPYVTHDESDDICASSATSFPPPPSTIASSCSPVSSFNTAMSTSPMGTHVSPPCIIPHHVKIDDEDDDVEEGKAEFDEDVVFQEAKEAHDDHDDAIQNNDHHKKQLIGKPNEKCSFLSFPTQQHQHHPHNHHHNHNINNCFCACKKINNSVSHSSTTAAASNLVCPHHYYLGGALVVRGLGGGDNTEDKEKAGGEGGGLQGVKSASSSSSSMFDFHQSSKSDEIRRKSVDLAITSASKNASLLTGVSNSSVSLNIFNSNNNNNHEEVRKNLFVEKQQQEQQQEEKVSSSDQIMMIMMDQQQQQRSVCPLKQLLENKRNTLEAQTTILKKKITALGNTTNGVPTV